MDAYMIRLALKRGGFQGDPLMVEDGEPALAVLRQDAPYENESLPDLVILDLNLKRIDGPQVLSYIRSTESLRHLAVVVLSSSPEDVMRSKAAEANGYFEKPSDVDEYFAVGKTIWTRFSEQFDAEQESTGEPPAAAHLQGQCPPDLREPV
jgi:two-component system, chemotaxis family, response regulator Rcp1